MSESKPQSTDEAEVEPNARYDAVFGTSYADEEETFAGDVEQEKAVLDHAETEAIQYEDVTDREGNPTLTWDHLSVTEDAQILASICSYFHGVSSAEEVEDIRRKLRTGDVEWYANTFLVASGVLDP